MADSSPEKDWFGGGDGHGYRYQYIGPIHYLCECGAQFLNRDRWIAHKAAPLVRRAVLDPGAFVKRGPDYDGEPYGERLDQWQSRAISVALDRGFSPEPTTGATAHFPACHLVDPRKSLNTCTACGGSTLLDPPCQPARDVPLTPTEPVFPPATSTPEEG